MWGRLTAAILSVTTLVFLFVHDSWRSDNLFLVPDLTLIVALAIASVVPDHFARVALPVGFAYAAGVFATSVSSYAIEGEFGLPSALGAVLAPALATLMTAQHPRPELSRAEPAVTQRS